MSRIGRQPIALPKSVSVLIKDGLLTAKGPKGELNVHIPQSFEVRNQDDEVTIICPSTSRNDRAMHGLTRTLVANAILGVSQGFVRNLELHGVGFRAKLVGKNLELTIGYSHPVVIEPPSGIAFSVPEDRKIQVMGIDKQIVGQIAANIRAVRAPDAYHGKGVRYEGERISLKPGKAGSAGGKGKK